MADQPEVKVVRWYQRSAAWRRLAADGGAFSVGGVAAVVSWKHIVHTSLMLHQDTLAAYLYPVSIDGMMIVGVVKAADDRASGRKVRGWARVATWVGGVLSVNAQVMSAYAYGALAAAWSVVPSATLIIVVEVMSRRGKLLPPVAVKQQQAAEQPAEETVSASAPVVEVAPVPAPVAAPEVLTGAPDVQVADVEAGEDVEEAPVVDSAPTRPRRRSKRTAYTGAIVDDADIDRALIDLREQRTTVAPDVDMVTADSPE